MNDTAVPAVRDKRTLDEVLLAMDVVDTLRHREQLVLTEIDAGAREAALLVRLKEIYAAQGIDVPERILKEGVKALEEKRFLYEPPKPSLWVSLARVYISREKWRGPVLGGLAAIAVLTGGYQVGVAGPAKAKAEAVRIELAVTLPAELDRLKAAIDDLATEGEARRLAQAVHLNGTTAIESGEAAPARAARDQLAQILADLKAVYDVRVVYGPDEVRSGLFRIPDDVPSGRNYYLIVEAVDPAGGLVTVTIASEEDRKTERVSRWGQRVTEEVFNSVATDKGDDQIIQQAVIGAKPAGRLTPVYSVATPGGAILEW